MEEVVRNAKAAQKLSCKKRQYNTRQLSILNFGKKRMDLLAVDVVDNAALCQREAACERFLASAEATRQQLRAKLLLS